MDRFSFEGGDSPRNDEPPDYDRRGYEYTPRTCLATLYDDAFPQIILVLSTKPLLCLLEQTDMQTNLHF